jgi:hypothetical protein
MNYGDFIQYIKDLGASHVDIQDIVIGDYEDIISRERSTIAYPCLWIETPSVRYTGDNDSPREIYEGAIVILQNGSNQDPSIIADNLSSTFLIAREFLFRISLFENYMNINNRRLDAIATLGNDNDQGWRFSFEIEQPFDVDASCADPARWLDLAEE